MRRFASLASALFLTACGGGVVSPGLLDASSPADAGGDAGSDAGAADAGQPDAGNPNDAGPDAGSPDAGASDAGAPDAGPPDAGPPDAGLAADPNLDGPYAVKTLDSSMSVPASGDSGIAIHCAYPSSGPRAGPYPVVVIAHGLSLPASQYAGYAARLASFGYVAMTVDYPASVFSINNTKEAQDLLGGLGWAAGNATVKAIANTQLAGMVGHSLGGKLALLAATMDARVKAVITLDPVDGGNGSCNPPSCVEVAALLPNLHLPTGFLGETTDSMGSSACAPANANYTTFYAKALSPSFEVTLPGANHMSFLDDEASCGFVCSLCAPATVPNAQVHDLARAYAAAFFERNLRGDGRYDAYLTGAIANARYVATGQAVIASR